MEKFLFKVETLGFQQYLSIKNNEHLFKLLKHLDLSHGNKNGIEEKNINEGITKKIFKEVLRKDTKKEFSERKFSVGPFLYNLRKFIREETVNNCIQEELTLEVGSGTYVEKASAETLEIIRNNRIKSKS